MASYPAAQAVKFARNMAHSLGITIYVVKTAIEGVYEIEQQLPADAELVERCEPRSKSSPMSHGHFQIAASAEK